MSQHLLAQGLSSRLGSLVPLLDARVRGEALDALAARVVALTDGQIEADANLVPALVGAASEGINHAEEIRRKMRDLAQRYEEAETPAARLELIRGELQGADADRQRWAFDLSATRRYLDMEALLERYAESISAELDRVDLAYSAARSLIGGAGPDSSLGRALDLGPLVEIVHGHAESARHEMVAVRALGFLASLLSLRPASERLPLMGVGRFRWLRKLSLHDRSSPWVRVAALRLTLMASPGDAPSLLEEQLARREPGDGMIVRYHSLSLLREASIPSEKMLGIARMARSDPSEHVRQGLSELLVAWGSSAALGELRGLLFEDESVRVRGHALRTLCARASGSTDLARAAESALAKTLKRLSGSPLPASEGLLLEIVLEQLTKLAACDEPLLNPATWVEPLQAVLQSPSLPAGLAERVGVMLLSLEVRSDRRLEEHRRTFRQALSGLGEGERTVVEFFPETPLADLEKALAVEAQGGLPVSLSARGGGRYRLTLGERRRLRLWRLLHELLTPAPDKRMGFAHARARFTEGESLISPLLMGEVTATRVPGERRFEQKLGGWGPFLPRIDDLFAALARGRRRIVTGFGTLLLRRPRTWRARLLAWVRLTLGYARYASLRDQSLTAEEPAQNAAYAVALRRLGFELSWESATGHVGALPFDRTVPGLGRYLGAIPALMPFSLPHWLEDFGYTLAAPRSNTAFHLFVVVWVILGGMLLRAAWVRRRVERSLAQIPFRIGGWGSRGKSGSERIKAALFHALRLDVVVKTTGCEAMLIHARRDREARELFLYRPYDKATIWEQEKVVGFGAELGAQVFLWECMALQPRFVGILMDEWMQDEIATLTNAYPDHEDVMGPSGEDVARVVATFMPKNGVVFTAEEQMLPLIRDRARRRGTRTVEVSPIDAALLPRDLLERFPYAEHPANIAMVLALAQHLGIDREWALVKMADHVVPDLGVLKTYPTVSLEGRTLTFSNAMSANERAGFLSCWTRLELDRLDLDGDPGTVSVAVVNNRADRVPRSHVFARLLARDAICDHIVLIGTNLPAMRRFLIDAFDQHVATLELGESSDAEAAMARIEKTLRSLRISTERRTLEARLVRILTSTGASEPEARSRVQKLSELDGEGIDAEGLARSLTEELEGELTGHLGRLLGQHAAITRVLSEVRSLLEAGAGSEARTVLRKHLGALLGERIEVVSDSHATGDQILARIAEIVPPGHDARVLGCQNIKGTGLDFAYRWVSIGRVDAELGRLESDPLGRDDALTFLRNHGDYGLCDARMALSRVSALLESDDPEIAALEPELGALAHHLSRVVHDRLGRLRGPPRRSLVSRALGLVEPWVDHLDAIRRSRKAQRIMDDLMQRRVSQGRAAVLLRELVARGKGGWLGSESKKAAGGER